MKTSPITILLKYLLLGFISLVMLYPIAMIFMTSLKTPQDFMGNPVGLPSQISFANYKSVWAQINFGRYSLNSILTTGISVIGIAILGAMAAYCLTHYFKKSNWVLNYFMLGMMIPTQSTIITMFLLLNKLHLNNKFTGLILSYIAINIPLAILIFSGYFRTIPKELEEAAMLDGCGEMRTFWKVVMPISKPTIATVIILTGMSVWNDFFLPLVLVTDKEKYTLAVGLLRLRGEFSVPWPEFFSAMGLIIIPIIILFLMMQNQFIKGMTSGSVKG